MRDPLQPLNFDPAFVFELIADIIDSNGWVYILTYFQNASIVYLKHRIVRNNTQEEMLKKNDVQILTNALDYLFENSRSYDNEHLLVLLMSLNQISYDTLENASKTDSPVKKEETQSRIDKISFGISKMYDTIKINLFRINIYWDQVVANFLCLATSKNRNIRGISTQKLGECIVAAFAHLENFYSKPDQEALQAAQFTQTEKWSQENYQQTLFQPWLDIIKCQCTESNEIVIDDIAKHFMNSGHLISLRGLEQVLLILQAISCESSQLAQNGTVSTFFSPPPACDLGRGAHVPTTSNTHSYDQPHTTQAHTI